MYPPGLCQVLREICEEGPEIQGPFIDVLAFSSYIVLSLQAGEEFEKAVARFVATGLTVLRRCLCECPLLD